ncbi:MAG: TaqI-like C-terminal specificity domain-containing protein [Desulfobacterales bacterium]
MNLNILTPRKALNKAFLKIKTVRNEFENFRTQLIGLLDRIDEKESEEFHKNLVSDFLKKTFYDPSHFINTKGHTDLVIHSGKDAQSPVAVIIETKKPGSKTEMLRTDSINVKAFQELVLYYLRERISGKNLEIRHLIATDIYEWFVFDANLFEREFAQNRHLISLFSDFESGRLSGKTTDFFYREIAAPAIAGITAEILFVHFDIRNYEHALRNPTPENDSRLIELFKIFSPEHLLKLPFANDSNSLDRNFYAELLHIIGAEETKEGNRKVIQRKKKQDRNTGFLIENTILRLDSLKRIKQPEKDDPSGETYEERLFTAALELVITWINRVLFLKLLEAHLISCHNGDKSYAFLHIGKIRNFDALNCLFFQVLACGKEQRDAEVSPAFDSIPWLNSSLFEPTELEDATIFVSNLKDLNRLPIFSSTVLKDEKGKKRTGDLRALEYLFAFLDAYDFSSEGSGEIQEEKKSLISASVLGLIFEKINGYRDGSYFTPGFVTMYMCRETVRRAVVQKFNEKKGWKCRDFNELYNKIEDMKEASEIVNSLKICDPAVGSGHFLVSALNEIIAVKNDLKILQDRDGKRLKEYHIEVVNDEITVTDEDGKCFAYHPKSRESQRVQEALFHEKQTIIEKCLFGVDINPNSVKICRLRLWIELLKHAYYKADGELETLPNIDINIRCGNSLISRFALDADVRQALRKSRWTVDAYRIAVQTYRESRNHEEKRALEKLMADIKKDFRAELGANNPKAAQMKKLTGDLHELLNQNHLFEQTAKEKKAREQKQKKLETEISRLSSEIKEMQTGRMYQNAFEWRFEFPEVLNDEGDFVGFDMVIGNPPYKMIQPNNTSINEIQYMKTFYPFADFKIDLFHLFFQKGSFLLKNKGFLCYISPSTLLNNVYAQGLRRMIAENHEICKIAAAKGKVFDVADVHTAIFLLKKENVKASEHTVRITAQLEEVIAGNTKCSQIKQKHFASLPGSVWNLLIDEKNFPIISKMARNRNLDTFARINRGLVTGNRSKYFSRTRISDSHIPVLTGSDILRYAHNKPGEFVLFERPETAGGCWDEEVHLSPYKICIRQIGTEPTATLIEKPYAVTGNIFTVTDGDLDSLKYWLAIINSNLVKYYWQIMFSDFKTSFPQVTIFSLKQIPIAEKKGKFASKTVSVVSKILAAKKKNANADTTALEREIDRLVYEIYGLAEEEIAIVEGRKT